MCRASMEISWRFHESGNVQVGDWGEGKEDDVEYTGTAGVSLSATKGFGFPSLPTDAAHLRVTVSHP